MKVFEKILDILFPKRCVYCGRKLDTEYEMCLCKKCEKIAYTKNIEPRQFEKKFFEKIVCCMDYSGYARKCFLKYKFYNVRYYKDTYGKMIYQRIFDDPFYKNADCVVNVPLSEERKKQRGFDQSEEIAKIVANLLDKPLYSDALIKAKNTAPLSKMSFKKRRETVRGLYKFNDKYDFSKKSVILIDDIFTSGATINECAKVLKMYGVKSVYAATVFNTPWHK